MFAAAAARASSRVKLGPLATVVAVLALVEFTSGALQAYYLPMLTDIARHLNIHDAQVNWFEGTQMMFSALAVPVFAKFGDMFGFKRILMSSIGVTAVASFVLPFAGSFGLFLLGWTLQGLYSAWLPLNIAIVWSYSRGREQPSLLTAKAAGVLVAALEAGAICGALTGGILVDRYPLRLALLVPAVLVVLCLLLVGFGVERSAVQPGGQLDLIGLALLSAALIAFTGGLSLLRIDGATSLFAWACVVAGIALLVPFVAYELRRHDPLVDMRMFCSPALAPVFVMAALFGVSVLGAQAPLSTFARTDPGEHGYGLGASGVTTSLLIGGYLLSMMAGALLFSRVARLFTPRVTLIAASCLVGTGYLLWVPLHHTVWQVVMNLTIAGVGAGMLAAALPAAAATAAPADETGMATGLTNSTKTLGGAIASTVFGMALMNGATASEGTAGSFTGYLTVWLVCAGTAFLGAAVLRFVPKSAFTDRGSAPHVGSL